jgi:hypothetical protein
MQRRLCVSGAGVSVEPRGLGGRLAAGIHFEDWRRSSIKVRDEVGRCDAQQQRQEAAG